MRYILQIVFVVAVGVLIFSTTTFGRSKALSNTNSCFQQLYNAPVLNADLLFTGSSRVRRGLNAGQVATLMGYTDGSALNYAHPSASLRFDLDLIDQALTKDVKIKMVVIEVLPLSEALEAAERQIDQRGNGHLDVTLSMGTFSNLFVLGTRVNTQFAFIDDTSTTRRLAAWEKFYLTGQRLTQFIPNLFSASNAVKLVLGEGVDPTRTNECFVRLWDDPTDDRQNGNADAVFKKESYKTVFDSGNWVDPDPLGFFTQDSSALDRQSIDAIIERVQAHGAQPVFLYIPSLHVPVTGELPTTFLEEFGAPLITPNQTLRDFLEDGLYYDNSHFNTQGRVVFTNWLATELTRLREGISQ